MPISKLVVGLGNPGLAYRMTRHNLGFLAAEALAKRHRVTLRRSAYRGRFGEGQAEGTPFGVLLPMTYMNLSGESVALAVRAFGLEAKDVLVVSDDIDLPLGKLRLRERGSSGGHNGLLSIIEALGTEDFPRLRIGIGRPKDDMVVSWVLGYFSPDEHTLIQKAIPLAVEALSLAVVGNLDAARMKLAEGVS